jgi:hypothetical protein
MTYYGGTIEKVSFLWIYILKFFCGWGRGIKEGEGRKPHSLYMLL